MLYLRLVCAPPRVGAHLRRLQLRLVRGEAFAVFFLCAVFCALCDVWSCCLVWLGEVHNLRCSWCVGCVLLPGVYATREGCSFECVSSLFLHVARFAFVEGWLSEDYKSGVC